MTNITKELADTFTKGGVKLAYGEPIEAGGATIIPVAGVSYGFGAGEGVTDDENNETSGGGGGGMTIPIGVYVTRNGKTRFEPNPVVLLVASIPLVFVTGHAIAKVMKSLKQ